MESKLVFREVDAGFYMGFIEPLETILNEKVANNYDISSLEETEERFCICDPNESFHKIVSGKFDTYVMSYKKTAEMKFLGSFSTFNKAVIYLTELYEKGINFATAPKTESEYYNSDYSDKKQSIFI
ncbi:hypothetical protein [Emticicia sp. W12TSBA100-4]|uniref:hypothetical protein n=1 Tax=Emticicia sp. W12TSBA100-4 TaxID=3160965 RepID=UPI0033058135